MYQAIFIQYSKTSHGIIYCPSLGRVSTVCKVLYHDHDAYSSLLEEIEIEIANLSPVFNFSKGYSPVETISGT